MIRRTRAGDPPMHKKRITVQSAKAKGRNLQQWVAKKISELVDMPWGKDEAIASREMGQSGTDIRLIGEAKKLFPYSVECKWCESWAIPAWIAQTKANQDAGTEWLLVIKKNHYHPIVVMDADHFFDLLSRIRIRELEK